MTKRMWIDELKKYLYLLPQKEEKEIMQYFEEVFADYYDQGYTDNEIINELGDPKEVAKSMVSSYLDDNEAIEEKERFKRDEQKPKFKERFKRGVDSFSNSVSNFCDRISASSRKKKASLDDEERSHYEHEIEEMRKRQEVYRQKMKEKDEELEQIKKERERLKENEKRMRAAEKVEVEFVDTNQKSQKDNYKIYTKANRHSFLANLLYTAFMIIFLGLGIALIALSIVLLVNDVTRLVDLIIELVNHNIHFSPNILINIGFKVVVNGAEVILLGIGTGIAIGCIKGIYKRFFVKKYLVGRVK